MFFIAFYSCKKDAVPESTDYPYVILSDIHEITSDGATFKANITNLGNQVITDYGFVWNDSTTKPTTNSIIKSFGTNPSSGYFKYEVTYNLEKGKTFSVRAYVKTDKVIVYSNVCSFVSKGCLPPVITEFSPTSGSAGSLITIIGKKFGSKSNYNKVYFGENLASIVKVYSDTLLVQCPNSSQSGAVKIGLEVAKQKINSTSDFNLIYPWSRTNDFIGGKRFASSFCVMNNFGYTSLGEMQSGSTYSANNFWQFSFDTKVWSQRKDFPALERSYATAFSANDLIYFGLGINLDNLTRFHDLWAYDPFTDVWAQKTNFPGEQFYNMNNFVINDTVYFYSYSYSDNEFYIYFPKTDTWQKQNEITQIPWITFSCSYNNKGYLIAENGDIWQFDPISKSFIKFGKIANVYSIEEGFCIGDVIYVRESAGMEMKSFNLKNCYQSIISSPCNTFSDIIFAFQNKAYISPVYSTDFWEFYPR